MRTSYSAQAAAWLFIAFLGCGDSTANTQERRDPVSHGDAAVPEWGDAGEAPEPSGPPLAPSERDTLLNSLVGQYWMRGDVQLRTNYVVNVISNVSTYSLVKIERDGDELVMSALQCEVINTQSCETPGLTCSGVTSETREGDARSYAPARRRLEVSADGKSWRAITDCPYAVGWMWDFAKDGEHELPTTDSDPLVYDPGEADGGGKGVNVTTTLETALGPQTCRDVRLVQRFDIHVEGTLEGGRFSQGIAMDLGSSQTVLDNGGCVGLEDAPPMALGDGTLLFARAAFTEGESWVCPSRDELSAKFAD